jgi:hypothetical protein
METDIINMADEGRGIDQEQKGQSRGFEFLIETSFAHYFFDVI